MKKSVHYKISTSSSSNTKPTIEGRASQRFTIDLTLHQENVKKDNTEEWISKKKEMLDKKLEIGVVKENYSCEVQDLREEDVQDLEKWLHDQKGMILLKTTKAENLGILGDLKKLQQKRRLEELEEDYNKMEPNINTFVLNSITNDLHLKSNQEQKEESLKNSIKKKLNYQTSKEKFGTRFKNLEAVKAEKTQEIMNQILFHKISQKLETEPQEKSLSTSLNLRKKLEVLTQKVCSSTLRNFKCISDNQLLHLNSHLESNLLAFLQGEKLKANRSESKLDSKEFDFREEELIRFEKHMQHFKSCKFDIETKKNKLIEIRKRISNFHELIRKIEAQTNYLKKKFLEIQDAIAMETDKTLKKNKRLLGAANGVYFNKFSVIPETCSLESILKDQEEEIKAKIAMISKYEKDIRVNNQKLIDVSAQIEDFKETKHSIEFLILESVKGILNSNPPIKSPYYVVKECLKNSIGLQPSLFPKYLDEKCIEYLLARCKIEIDIENLTDQYNDLLKNPFSENNKEIFNDEENYVKKLKTRKPEMISKFGKKLSSNLLTFESNTLLQSTETLEFQKQNHNPLLTSKSDSADLDFFADKISMLRRSLNELTLEEQIRLSQKFQDMESSNGNNAKKVALEKISRILTYLFGQNFTEEFLTKRKFDFQNRKNRINSLKYDKKFMNEFSTKREIPSSIILKQNDLGKMLKTKLQTPNFPKDITKYLFRRGNNEQASI